MQIDTRGHLGGAGVAAATRGSPPETQKRTLEGVLKRSSKHRKRNAKLQASECLSIFGTEEAEQRMKNPGSWQQELAWLKNPGLWQQELAWLRHGTTDPQQGDKRG